MSFYSPSDFIESYNKVIVQDISTLFPETFSNPSKLKELTKENSNFKFVKNLIDLQFSQLCEKFDIGESSDFHNMALMTYSYYILNIQNKQQQDLIEKLKKTNEINQDLIDNLYDKLSNITKQVDDLKKNIGDIMGNEED